jgi:CheY-like chemotaxis protein
VRHLVELHNGSVHAISEGEGLGATFTIKLPLLEELPAPIEVVRAQKPNHFNKFNNLPSLGALRILVVDDEEDARNLLVKILEMYGAEVKAACSAAEALDTFDFWHPDVLVSDIGMPGEDGYSLINRLRAHETGRPIPAIALTAYARAIDRQRALQAGFQMHVAKPIQPARLAEVVARVASFAAGQR